MLCRSRQDHTGHLHLRPPGGARECGPAFILHNQDFDPHNDKRAADREYRIGQKHDVEVIKLISKGMVEEEILRLGEISSRRGCCRRESVAEKQSKASLMNSIKRQLVLEDEQKSDFLNIKVDSDSPLSTLSVPLRNENKPELDE
ncbi:hypothetical protein BKA62DRAFT_649352 [Auriculariales sp. MPI-PUGE-AT-0066]|nr:hypothetical protein BKA62DRAFT_649352 [Auriculariales sp. MPI-PUGE-AT-0066]